MATWKEFANAEPSLAKAVRARFEATKHHVMATVRRDGSPRVSGTEVDFQGPDLTFGSMWGAVKARDLQRDGRFALHANPGNGSMEGGDAKIAGRAVEVVREDGPPTIDQGGGEPEPYHLFRLDIDEVVLTSLTPTGDALLIEKWRPGASVERFERRGSDPPRRVG